jgi:hypothetical protein
MPDFRAYILGHDGHFIGVHEFAASDRGEAAKKALAFVDGHSVELWEGPEQVAIFKPVKGGNPIFKRFRLTRPGKPQPR